MRTQINRLGLITLAALVSACASTEKMPMTPSMLAAHQATVSNQMAEARLRDLRNAEARLRLAGARIDFSKTVDEGDLREFLAAREDLRRLRATYGSTDSGYRARFHPFHWGTWGRRTGDYSMNMQDGTNTGLNPGAAMPLSASSAK